MNPVTSLPAPEPDPKMVNVHVGRNGEVIGKWPLSEIRQLIIVGHIRTDDYLWHKGLPDWVRVLPSYSVNHFPFSGEDHPLWFIRDGFVYGPRTAEEIDALVASGWLTGDTLVSGITSVCWNTVDELVKEAGGSQQEESAWSGFGKVFLRAFQLKMMGISTLAVVADHFLNGPPDSKQPPR